MVRPFESPADSLDTNLTQTGLQGQLRVWVMGSVLDQQVQGQPSCNPYKLEPQGGGWVSGGRERAGL